MSAMIRFVFFISNNRQDKEYNGWGLPWCASTVATVLLIHGACGRATSLGIRERLVARGARLARACARLREWAGEGRGGIRDTVRGMAGGPRPRVPVPGTRGVQHHTHALMQEGGSVERRGAQPVLR